MFKGRFIKARLKSRQLIFLPLSVPTPTPPSLPNAESLQSHASVADTPFDVASSRDDQESVTSAPGFGATLPPIASLSNELRVLSIEPAPNQPIPAPPAVPVAQASVQQPQQLFAPQNYAMPALMATGQQQQAVGYLTQANAGLPFAQQFSLVPMQQFFTRVSEPSALVCILRTSSRVHYRKIYSYCILVHVRIRRTKTVSLHSVLRKDKVLLRVRFSQSTAKSRPFTPLACHATCIATRDATGRTQHTARGSVALCAHDNEDLS